MDDKILVRDCFISLKCLQDRLHELRQSKYPSKSIEPFFLFFDVLFSRLEKCLKQIETETDLGGKFDDVTRFFWSFFKSDMVEYLNDIGSSNSTMVPHEMIRSLEELVHAVSPGVCLLFRPFQDHNYSHMDVLGLLTNKLDVYLKEFYEGTEFKNLLEEYRIELTKQRLESDDVLDPDNGEKKQADDQVTDKLSVIAFPALEKKAFVQHCLVGHEIGHLVAQDGVNRISTKIELDEVVKGELDEYLELQKKADGGKLDADEVTDLVADCFDLTKRYFTEIYCDYVGYVIFGWPALFAEYHFHLGRENLDKPGIQHPPDRHRLFRMIEYVELDTLGDKFVDLDAEELAQVRKKIDDLTEFAGNPKEYEEREKSFDILTRIALAAVNENLHHIVDDVNRTFDRLKLKGSDIDTKIVIRLYRRLCNKVTPNLAWEIFDDDKPKEEEQDVEFRHIMASAWVYKICELEKERPRTEYEEESELCDRLSLRATEVNFVQRRHLEFTQRKLDEGASKKKVGLDLQPKLLEAPEIEGAVLCSSQILSLLKHQDPKRRLDVTPFFRLDQISDGAIDVRLGNEFITFKRTEFPALDVKHLKNVIERRLGQYHSRYKIDFGAPFVLHPNELVLGSTLEYVSLPTDIFAFVLSRSSWGRLGLLIATATAVNPGYQGCLTLELVNLGEVPLVLYPGLPVAQLILIKSSSGKYDGHFQGSTGPRFSNVHTKTMENEFWTRPFDG